MIHSETGSVFVIFVGISAHVLFYNVALEVIFPSGILISIITTKQYNSMTMLTCWSTLKLPKNQPLSPFNGPLHVQDWKCILIHSDNISDLLLIWTISHILCSSPPPPLCLPPQGLIAPMQWAVQVVWVRAREVLSVCRPTCQLPTRGKEPSQMTSINWWTTGPEMPWTSHRFTAVLFFILL